VTQTIHLGQLISQELLDGVKAIFPAQRVQVTDTERTIFLRSGQQEVIEFMERQFNERFAQTMESQDVSSEGP
jgi:hypothetical protein